MKYSVLEPQHIRVLKLEPSAHHDSIMTCSLAAVPFSENAVIPRYEALSYAWGDLTEQKEILLDGQPKLITQNLWTALKYLRQPEASRTLWIDAICINQTDIHERNDQVRQMGRIYSRASRVLIWLGPPDAEIESTMSTLQDPKALEGKVLDRFPKEIAIGLKKILSQPWWHRIWVIQEHVLASAEPLVGCGDTWLDWDLLVKALLEYAYSLIDSGESTFTNDSPTWATDPSAIMSHVLLRKEWNDPKDNSAERGTIAAVVERTRGCQASDKRDQVFALANLLREEERDQFLADYGKSTNEVYQKATVAFIQSTRSLAFLIHAISKDDETLGLPTWCVDFSKKLWEWGLYSKIKMRRRDSGESDEYKEIDRYMDVLSHDTSLGTLKVLGGFFGEVVNSYPLIPRTALGQPQPNWDFVSMLFIDQVLTMSVVAYRIWSDRYGAQTAKELLARGKVWETVFGEGCILFYMVDCVCAAAKIEKVVGSDRPYEFWVIEAFVRETCSWYTKGLRRQGALHPTPELEDSPRLKTALGATLVMLTQTCTSSWWFITDTGYVARVNHEVKQGDRLCTISGCNHPLVLRPHDGGTFQLIAVPSSERFHADEHRKLVREVELEVLTLV